MADVQESPRTSDPPSKGKLFIDKLNAGRNIILALAALATAVGSWFRPQDDTATKQSYAWTAQKIEELSKNDVRTHNDLTSMRTYLEGYIQGQQNAQKAAAAVTAQEKAPPSVGMGSLGTIGHGAGTGSGYGVGAGSLAGDGSASPSSSKASTASKKRPRVRVLSADPAPVVANAAPPPPLPDLQSKPVSIKSPEFENLPEVKE